MCKGDNREARQGNPLHNTDNAILVFRPFVGVLLYSSLRILLKTRYHVQLGKSNRSFHPVLREMHMLLCANCIGMLQGIALNSRGNQYSASYTDTREGHLPADWMCPISPLLKSHAKNTVKSTLASFSPLSITARDFDCPSILPDSVKIQVSPPLRSANTPSFSFVSRTKSKT